MSSPAPQPRTPPHPTRQQLDDLDALLRRMLALPVNAPEDDPVPLPQPEELSPPPGNMILADPMAPPPGNMVLADPMAPPPGNMVLADPISAPPAVVRIPAAPGDPLPLPLLNPVPPHERRPPLLALPAAPPSVPRPAGSSRPPRVSLPLRPLVWGNRAFDRVALGWGGPGNWLRRPGGRAALGMTGLLLLAAAAALVVLDRIGWTW